MVRQTREMRVALSRYNQAKEGLFAEPEEEQLAALRKLKEARDAAEGVAPEPELKSVTRTIRREVKRRDDERQLKLIGDDR